MNAGDLVTWEQVKSILSLDDDSKDEVEFLISSASEQAEKIANRFLSSRDIKMLFDTRGGFEILLPSWPVNSVSRLCIDLLREFPSSEDLSPDEYGIKNNSGIIRLYKKRFPYALDCVFFSGNIGYSPIPKDLQQAVIEIISANLRRFNGSQGQVGIKTVSANGAVTTTYEIDIPITSRNVFLSYRGATI